MKRGQTQTGFTIVELLIVVVVIAILAAITIVSYNGITERSKTSAASSALNQVSKKIALWKVANADQLPATLADAGVTNAASTSYDYRRFDTNTKYCLSVTTGEVSYYVRSTNTASYIKGSCSDVSTIADAGEPLGPVMTQSAPAISFPATSGTPDLILYAVFDALNTDTGYSGIASFGPAIDGRRMHLDTGNAGTDGARYRIDTSAMLNASSMQLGVRDGGRHIGWLQVRAGMTIREFGYDRAAPTNSAALNPGTGWIFSSAVLGGANSSTAPIAAIAYNATHDQATRARVMQWLADSYNVSATY